MKHKSYEIVGIVPAAGHASRISPIPCSKEIFPVGFEDSAEGDPKITVAASYLLKSMSEAGADQIYMVTRKGKWDIPHYLGVGDQPEYTLAYIFTDPTEGTHYTIDLGYRFVRGKMVLLGFPDILFKPKNAYHFLLDKQQKTGAEVVLGLFKAGDPTKADMVDTDEQGRIRKIVIKPDRTQLTYTWTIAVWTPAFSDYLHEFVAETGMVKSLKKEKKREIFIGDVIQSAIEQGVMVETVLFEEGAFIDIGTVPELKRVLNRGFGPNSQDW